MRVTAAAKKIEELEEFGHQWPDSLPQCIYRLRVPQLPSGEPMTLGEEFHLNLERHLNGEWIAKEFYYSANSVGEILRDLGFLLKDLKSEIPLLKGKLSGIADLAGQDSEGRNCVVEIKTTQGRFVMSPQRWELAQMAMYAEMLDLERPRLVCIRLNFRFGIASVFSADFETETIRAMVKAA